MKKNQYYDSSVSIKGDVNIRGDGAIGRNAKILKIVKDHEKIGLLGLLSLIASLIGIYSFVSE